GIYWVTLMDSYGASFALLIFAICECCALSWLYGVKRFQNDIRTMIGDGWVDFPAFVCWPIIWCIITPALLSFVLWFNWLNWSSPTDIDADIVWAHFIGWAMIVMSLIWIPGVMVYQFIAGEGSAAERWRAMSNPRDSWGPALQKHRQEAWETHIAHGTTMGGKLEGGITIKCAPDDEPPVMYSNTAYEAPV
ncbi:hypothetical protein, partial [Salmonella sp. s55004]|uniref:hypothetical protein n=2 Tax=unclassified Salmonella TaxID=2614656 RepID=UPI0039804AA5